MLHLRAYPLDPATQAPWSLPPEQALARLFHRHRPFLLDGSGDGDGLGRYSYAGCDPLDAWVVPDVPALPHNAPSNGHPPAIHHLRARDATQPIVAPAAALFAALQATIERWHPLIAVGLLDYELGRASEVLPSHAAPHDLGTAAVDFAAYDALYRYDADRGLADILAVDPDAAARLRHKLAQPAPPPPPLQCGPLRSLTSPAQHARAIATIVEHLRAGDCYQVNVCRWLRARLATPSVLSAYLALRRIAPAPLGSFIRFDPPSPSTLASDAPALLSNSPELLLAYDFPAGTLQTRPIKGTRRRASDPIADDALRDALRMSSKDSAEHIMIVDLLRNDLGRIAQPGSVRVDGLMRCVSLPTVHHLISTVQATPAPRIGLAQLLHALLPGGSITGAPKLSAITLIDQLEPHRRGPFYGALGWLSRDRGALSLCIRTAIAHRDQITLAVGGGIVLDSTPDEEWAETEAKAAAFARALVA